jgi:outer membrane immunogenic protein
VVNRRIGTRAPFASLAVLIFGFAGAHKAAADVTAPWSGPYVGLFAGYDKANDAWRPDTTAGSPSLSPQGILGGGLVGGNFRFDAFLVGVEADLMFADFADAEPCDNAGADCSIDGRVMASLRARGGFIVDRALIYATGGPALSYVKATSSALGGTSDSQALVGWTLGAGVETALGEHLRVGFEYRHTDYGKADLNLSGVSDGIDFVTDEATLRLIMPLD